jgi:hypothetical protein
MEELCEEAERALGEANILDEDVGTLVGATYEGSDEDIAEKLREGQVLLVWLSDRNLTGIKQQKRVLAGTLSKYEAGERHYTVIIPGELVLCGMNGLALHGSKKEDLTSTLAHLFSGRVRDKSHLQCVGNLNL